MAIALLRTAGPVYINGRMASPRHRGHVILAEDAFVDPGPKGRFTLHPIRADGALGPVYAEVRGLKARLLAGDAPGPWRIRVDAPGADVKRRGKRPKLPTTPNDTNPPVSYLHWRTEVFFACFELQVNEGCVRIAASLEPYHPEANS